MSKNTKLALISSVIITTALILIYFFCRYGVEYIKIAKRIKNSDTYNSNIVCVKYDKEYNVKIPKGLGDLEVKGNIHYCLKSTKSVDKLKKEFEEIYGSNNIRVDRKDYFTEYYYMDVENQYVVCVVYDGGIFSDVHITDVKSIGKGE